jgi:hypothetical protein
MLVGVHGAFAVHDTHDPALQTMLDPHDWPVGTLLALVHVETPLMQDVVPVWQRLPFGLHGWFAVHAEHDPALQTRLVPHDVPLPTLVPVSVHTWVPDAQEVVPTWQLLVGVQGVFAVHATHAPALQTMLVPQAVPGGAFERLAHVCEPVEHE